MIAAIRSESQPPTEATLAVGIGQCIVTRDPSVTLVSYGLGSCVGIAAWDNHSRVAGLIHILLPEPPESNTNPISPARFALTGVPYLLHELDALGATRSHLRLVATGGAQMLGALSTAGQLKGIGDRNAAIVIETLREHGLSLVAHEFGGTTGRTISLSVATGTVNVRASGGTAHEL